jgi:hypothetical protein
MADRSQETTEAELLRLEREVREHFDPLQAGECNPILEALNQAFNLGCAVREPTERRIRKLEAERAKLGTALSKINEIRNSIVGYQLVNFSAHIYPLVAALNEAGFQGEGYEEARAKAKTQVERIASLESQLATAREGAAKEALREAALVCERRANSAHSWTSREVLRLASDEIAKLQVSELLASPPPRGCSCDSPAVGLHDVACPLNEAPPPRVDAVTLLIGKQTGAISVLGSREEAEAARDRLNETHEQYGVGPDVDYPYRVETWSVHGAADRDEDSALRLAVKQMRADCLDCLQVGEHTAEEGVLYSEFAGRLDAALEGRSWEHDEAVIEQLNALPAPPSQPAAGTEESDG